MTSLLFAYCFCLLFVGRIDFAIDDRNEWQGNNCLCIFFVAV